MSKRQVDPLTIKVKKFMSEGLAPSEIDKKLKLPNGTAHDIVITEWRIEKYGYYEELSV